MAGAEWIVIVNRSKKVSAAAGRSGYVLPDIYDRIAFCHSFCDAKNFMGDMLVNVILTAVCADLGGNFLDNKGKTIAIEGDSCQSFFCLPVFTAFNKLIEPRFLSTPHLRGFLHVHFPLF